MGGAWYLVARECRAYVCVDSSCPVFSVPNCLLAVSLRHSELYNSTIVHMQMGLAAESLSAGTSAAGLLLPPGDWHRLNFSLQTRSKHCVSSILYYLLSCILYLRATPPRPPA